MATVPGQPRADNDYGDSRLVTGTPAIVSRVNGDVPLPADMAFIRQINNESLRFVRPYVFGTAFVVEQVVAPYPVDGSLPGAAGKALFAQDVTNSIQQFGWISQL